MVRQTSFAFDHDQTLELCPFLIGVHVGEEFRVCGGPAATDFDATMVFFNGLVVVVGKMHELASPFAGEHRVNILVQLSLVLFERQHIVGAPLSPATAQSISDSRWHRS